MKSALVLLASMLVVPAWAQYAGPAILARGAAPAAMASPQIEFRPFVEVGATYSTGLANVAVNGQGQVANATGEGLSLAWGISGSHSWRHTKVGLEYRGHYTHYIRPSGYDYIDQSLLLGVTHQIARHATLNLRQTAGIVQHNFGPLGLRQTVPFDPSTAYVPVTDYFDNRTMYLTSQADLILQKSARLSYDLGGGIYLIARQAKALYGTQGISAHGDAHYRLSRRGTIGAQYGFMRFSYPHLWGDTVAHTVVGSYSMRVSRWVEFSGYGGIVRVESSFIQSVPVDPIIAALLGISGAPQIIHKINYSPNMAGRVSRTFRTGVLYAAAGHSVYPGNGMFLTSTMTTVMSGYSYTGLRRWSFGASAGYEAANSNTTIVGAYGDTNQSLVVSRQILSRVHFVLSYVARQYRSPQFANYDRNMSEGRVSIGYSPGDIPLRVW